MIQDINQKSETLRKLHEEDGKVMKNIREFIDRIGGSRKVFEMNNKPFYLLNLKRRQEEIGVQLSAQNALMSVLYNDHIQRR